MSLMVLQEKAKGKENLRHWREEAQFLHPYRADGQERAVWEELLESQQCLLKPI